MLISSDTSALTHALMQLSYTSLSILQTTYCSHTQSLPPLSRSPHHSKLAHSSFFAAVHEDEAFTLFFLLLLFLLRGPTKLPSREPMFLL